MRMLVAALAILLAVPTVSALGAPMRTAKVGDRMGGLIVGMARVDSGRKGTCGDVAVQIVDYIVPGRPRDEDHASFIGAWAYDRLVVLVSFDEGDLTAPVTVYADLAGQGLVTDLWAVDEAPGGCELIQRASHV
jgi:hypothetical protein